MVIGTTLYKLDGNPYFSPEFGRGGLSATFSIDTTQFLATALNITVESRNSEDIVWTTVGSFSPITGAGVTPVDLTGLKEIVRFSYTFDPSDPSTAAVHFLMQAPSWRPY